MGLRLFATGGLLAVLIAAPAAAQKTRFDGLLACERRAAVQFKVHNAAFRRFVIDRQTVEIDRFADRVGNQYVSTIYHGRATYETAGGAIGTAASAGFLYLIALLNLIVLAGIFKVFREMRAGTYNEQQLEEQLQARGLMYRFFGRFMRSINHTWQLYFVGLVFGIGFDTTTEVLLLAATTYAALAGLPYFAVLALPFLFSGGMMLFDTLDGVFMNFAYGWAFARPVRKVYYNLVITALSIGAAFIVGTIEILGVLTSEVHLRGAFWDVMANFNINLAGFCIAGMFIAVWAAALIYWRVGKVEGKWTAGMASAPAPAAAPRPQEAAPEP